MADKILYVVHCIDTEGPLDEDIDSTFDRIDQMFGLKFEPSSKTLKDLQECRIPLNGQEAAVAKAISPQLLNYVRTREQLVAMLDKALSPEFRNEMLDDYGQGWVYSWHCLDHVGIVDNPRHKDLGYGNIFRFYRRMLAETNSTRDEINWHFHPLSLTRNALHGATNYNINMDILLHVISRRIIEDGWFPVTNRPGFHAERPDSHLFFEQWMPFDYANQYYEGGNDGQRDMSNGRGADWTRAPATWRGYRPHHDDYQAEGNCRRWIFRCLNVGSRMRLLNTGHVEQAFGEAREHGSAILSFANHDFRDLRPDVNTVRDYLTQLRGQFKDVKIKFCGSEAAAREHLYGDQPDLLAQKPELKLSFDGLRVMIDNQGGPIFGPQPFLSLRTKEGRYYHDNVDVQQPGKLWSYTLDQQSFPPECVDVVGVGVAGRWGKFDAQVIKIAG